MGVFVVVDADVVVVVVVDVIVDVAVVMEGYSYRTLEVMMRTMAVVTSAR